MKNRQTYEDKDINVQESYRQKLQHAELKGKGIQWMAYDATPNTPINHGNQIHRSVDIGNRSEAEQVCNQWSQGGQVHHKFREREWGYFGGCTDKFGINGMVNTSN